MEFNRAVWDNPKEKVRLQLEPLSTKELFSARVFRVVIMATLYIYIVWQVFFCQAQLPLQLIMIHSFGKDLGILTWVFVAGIAGLSSVMLVIYLLARWRASNGFYLFISLMSWAVAVLFKHAAK
jgi:hypothetical protein